MLQKLLSTQESLVARGGATSQSLRNNAEMLDKSAHESREQILDAIWSGGQTTGDVTTDLALAMYGEPSSELVSYLKSVEARLETMRGQFLLKSSMFGDFHKVGIGIIGKTGLTFDRTPRTSFSKHTGRTSNIERTGRMVLPVTHAIFCDIEWLWGWKTKNLKSVDEIAHEISHTGEPYRASGQVSRMFDGQYAGILLGDDEVWKKLESRWNHKDQIPFPIVAGSIAEKLRRPLGRIPTWKERSADFKAKCDAALPKLTRLSNDLKRTKRSLGSDSDSEFLSVSNNINSLRRETKEKQDTVRKFIAQWNAS